MEKEEISKVEINANNGGQAIVVNNGGTAYITQNNLGQNKNLRQRVKSRT